MSYINTYTPPQGTPSSYGLYGPTPYDLNISFPILLDTLESDRLKLTPFIPSLHFEAFVAGIPDPKAFYRYLPFDMETEEDLLEYLDVGIRQNPSHLLLAIIDKTKPDDTHDFGGTLAGAVAFMNQSPHNLVTEIGCVMVHPAFQRTHVTTHLVGLMLRHSLQKPDASPPGLGLRRVYWCCHPDNAPSLKAANRMGFKYEGTMRWTWVLPEGKAGKVPGENDTCRRHGRDTTTLSITWEDWENGGAREHIDQVMDRIS